VHDPLPSIGGQVDFMVARHSLQRALDEVPMSP